MSKPSQPIAPERAPAPGMTVEAFLRWHETRPETEHYELRNGAVIAMAPELSAHNRIKCLVWLALRTGIRTSGLGCEAFGDGMTVRIDERTAYEPDAVVHCGDPVAADVREIPTPVLVVEVLSASTKGLDTGLKLGDYFRVPSLVHYLLVEAHRPRVIVHRRCQDGRIETRIVSEGVLRCDPPGFDVDIGAFYDG